MKKIMLFLCLFAGIVTASCKKSSTPAPDTTLTQINGSVLLFDEGEKAVDRSGMNVAIDGSNPVVQTTTDNNGFFSLPVPRSLKSFALVYSKPGYGTYKDFWERQKGDTLFNYVKDQGWLKTNVGTAILGQKTTVTINTFSVEIKGDSILFHCNITSPNTTGDKYVFMIYQKDNASLNYGNVDKTKIYWYYWTKVQNGDNTYGFCLTCPSLFHGWGSGDKMYFNVYPKSFYSNSYLDILGDNLIHDPNDIFVNNLSPASVTIP